MKEAFATCAIIGAVLFFLYGCTIPVTVVTGTVVVGVAVEAEMDVER